MVRKSNNTALNQLSSNINSNKLDNVLSKEITFAATTTGAVATHALVTVTGVVAACVIGICSTNVTGTGTIEVGSAKDTDGFIAQTTGTDLDANEIWHDATPDNSIEAISIIANKVAIQDIAYKIATNTLTAGVVKFYILWTPISIDGNVILA